MSDNVLYFPYINVPHSNWLVRTLLYWDAVGVIMPLEFVERPDKLRPFTRDLLIAGLLTQVFPAQYLADLPNFSPNFISYLNTLGSELDVRRRRFKKESGRSKKRRGDQIHLEKFGVIPIHLEKMEGLAAELIDQQLAALVNPPWVSVEASTGEEFMYYLAIVLGQHKEVQLTPVTDERDKLQRLSAVSRRRRAEKTLDDLRIDVLEDILPAPDRPISVLEIETFKMKFGNNLAAFRRKVEMEIVSLADIRDPNLRKRRLELFKEGCNEEIDEIKARMKESKWPSIVFGKVCALLSPVPIIGQVTSVINAAYTALGSGGPREINSALAYAAYARTRLFRN